MPHAYRFLFSIIARTHVADGRVHAISAIRSRCYEYGSFRYFFGGVGSRSQSAGLSRAATRCRLQEYF